MTDPFLVCKKYLVAMLLATSMRLDDMWQICSSLKHTKVKVTFIAGLTVLRSWKID